MEAIEGEKKLLLKIRLLTVFFIAALVVSGITAFPLEDELRIVCSLMGVSQDSPSEDLNTLQYWLLHVYEGVCSTNASYPFIAYGTDWLAFAHIVIAIAFVGVIFKPVRNVWIVYWAMIACILVLPTVFICGAMREIPFYWQLVDCSFGVFGMVPLLILRHYINRLAAISGCYVPTKY